VEIRCSPASLALSVRRLRLGFSFASMSAPLREYDVVRVARLNAPAREFTGTESVRRAPRVGDRATVCEMYDRKDPGAPVAVEMVDAQGMTVWLADFAPDELELIHRP
jgi:hypothetical protein